jgi:hypothetical protein
MLAFVQVSLQQWIAEEEGVVRAQFADVQHHMGHGVHRDLRYELLSQGFGRARFIQHRRGWLRTLSSAISRETEPDGTLLDTVVHGADRGATMAYRFTSSSVDAVVGTMVEMVWRQPTPAWAALAGTGWLRRHLLARLRRWADEDRFDLEVRGYIPLMHQDAA